MIKMCYIIRGLPGSGKSTLAKRLAAAVCSEDDYWTAPDGTYHFDPATRREAFASMAESALAFIGYGYRQIAVATAALSFDAEPLPAIIRAAEGRGYNVQLMFLPLRAGRTSIHHVTPEDYARFRREMQHELEVGF